MIIIDVEKKLNDFTLDASLKFGRELAILTGPNGSGKSTLLRTIAGLERPDEGQVSVMGHVLFNKDEDVNVAPEKRQLGYVFQDGALFPWLTVEKNILFSIPKSSRKNETKWLEQLYFELNIEHLLTRYPVRLSGGEAQRVALARALATRPKMLLLDEPFAAADTAIRPRLRRFLKELQQEWEIPILMVTHDNAEAYVLGDRIFELREGRVTIRNERGKVIQMPLVSY